MDLPTQPILYFLHDGHGLISDHPEREGAIPLAEAVNATIAAAATRAERAAGQENLSGLPPWRRADPDERYPVTVIASSPGLHCGVNMRCGLDADGALLVDDTLGWGDHRQRGNEVLTQIPGGVPVDALGADCWRLADLTLAYARAVPPGQRPAGPIALPAPATPAAPRPGLGPGHHARQGGWPSLSTVDRRHGSVRRGPS